MNGGVKRDRDDVLPLVIEAGAAGVGAGGDLAAHARRHLDGLVVALRRHGALLFRGFAVEDVAGFEAAVRCFAPALRRYQGGDSPRIAVAERVYTSTSYPPSLPISLHNEMSYSREYPSIIAFHCEIPPRRAGETPLADGRRALAALPAELAARLRAKKLRYIQNLPDGAGLGKSWRATFESEDRREVEALLAARGAAFEWKRDGALRVAEIVEPIVVHPHTGEEVLFCQAHLWHISSLDIRTRSALARLVAEGDLYHHCTYGDGTPLEEQELGAIRDALDSAAVKFPWQRRDVLVVDNVLVAHGRSPFEGERRILVAMG
jgi:alpha-ketoglutarate-dependent taurine dioxygenase